MNRMKERNIRRMSRQELSQPKPAPHFIGEAVLRECSDRGWTDYLRLRRELSLDDPRNHPSVTLMQRHCDI